MLHGLRKMIAANLSSLVLGLFNVICEIGFLSDEKYWRAMPWPRPFGLYASNYHIYRLPSLISEGRVVVKLLSIGFFIAQRELLVVQMQLS